MKIDPETFEKMKRLRGSKDPHDICKLNGMLALNAHLLFEQLIWSEEQAATVRGSLSKPSEEALASSLSRGVGEAPQPLATTGHSSVADPAGVIEQRFNVNDTVRVKLTPCGMEIWQTYYRDFVNQPIPERIKDGWLCETLWAVMHIFGNHCFNGSKSQPFETEIILELKS